MREGVEGKFKVARKVQLPGTKMRSGKVEGRGKWKKVEGGKKVQGKSGWRVERGKRK